MKKSLKRLLPLLLDRESSPSFRRMPESRADEDTESQDDQENDKAQRQIQRPWIPAFAGMTNKTTPLRSGPFLGTARGRDLGQARGPVPTGRTFTEARENRRGFVLALNHPVSFELFDLFFREAEQIAQNLLVVLAAQGRRGFIAAGGFAELERKGGGLDAAQGAQRGVGEVFYHAARLQVRPGEDVFYGVDGPANDVEAAAAP